MNDPKTDEPAFEDLVQEPALLAADLEEIQAREPELWHRFSSTGEYATAYADWELPYLVVRTHVEEIDCVPVRFCLLAMRPHPKYECEVPMMFGEIALSPALYDELVKPYGLLGPVPRTARGLVPHIASFKYWDELMLRVMLDPDVDDWD